MSIPTKVGSFDYKTKPKPKAGIIEEEEIDFIPFEDVNEESPGFFSESGRHIARSASRVGERLLGAPGDIYSLLDSTLDKAVESTLPEIAQMPAKVAGRIVLKGPLAAANPPTSSELKQISYEETGGYTAPQNQIEKAIDEVFENAASMAFGRNYGSGLKEIGGNIIRDIGVAASGQLAKQGVKEFGGGEVAQELANFGTMILSTFLGAVDPNEVANSLYKKRDALITPQTKVNANQLLQDLQVAEKQLLLGGAPAPAEAQLLREIQAIRNKVQNGEIAVQELTKWQQQLNRMRRNYPEIKWDNRQIDSLRQANQKAIRQYPDPVFQELHQQANEVYGATRQAETAANFINRSLPASMRGGLLGGLLSHALNNPYYLGTAGVGLGAAAAGMQGYRILRHVMQSPTLRRHYLNLIKGAVEQNAPAVIQNAAVLKQELDKDKEYWKDLSEEEFIPLDSVY